MQPEEQSQSQQQAQTQSINESIAESQSISGSGRICCPQCRSTRVRAHGGFISILLVADVYTFSYEGLVVEEAVGFVDLIVIACPLAEGKAFLAAGPVFSYYKFKHPMKDRLTDEAWGKIFEFWFPTDTGISYEQWRQERKSRKKPERPKWYTPLMVQKNNAEVQQ